MTQQPMCFPNFKSLKAYKYFADNLVRNVHAGHTIWYQSSLFVVFEGKHYILSYFLAMKRNCTVVAAQCSCVAGQGESRSCTSVQFGRQNESEGLASPC